MKTVWLGGDASDALTLRARASRCTRRAPVKLIVAVGGRKVGGLRLRGTRWRDLRLPQPLPAGDHAVQLELRGGRPRCRRGTVDEVRRVVVATPRPAPVLNPLTPLGPRRPMALATALDWSASMRDDHQLDRTFLGRFDGLTPENAMKMTYVEPERGRFEFFKTDSLMKYAEQHGKSVHGHVLVWHSQLPAWLTKRRWSPAELEQILHDWIAAIVGRYRGRIGEWDVINEVLDDDGSWRQSIWFETLGPRYVDLALRFAHEADPAAKLYINDYDADLPGPKQDALAKLVADLRARGLPLDGVGFQTHWSLERTPPTEAALLGVFRRFAALGVDLQVTEMDVAIDTRPDPLARQAAAYASVARVCQSVAACNRFTVWGVSDKDSWRGAYARALLFDDHYAEKPAYRAVRDALSAG